MRSIILKIFRIVGMNSEIDYLLRMYTKCTQVFV